jgi:hypothetical protein
MVKYGQMKELEIRCAVCGAILGIALVVVGEFNPHSSEKAGPDWHPESHICQVADHTPMGTSGTTVMGIMFASSPSKGA